jgi:predicted unusual protein kinase regulating ubiquinone biosynthesis (AarF/ABC1/UbiB family)
MKKDIRSIVADKLRERGGEKIPTSSVGRLGRMAWTALRSGTMAVSVMRNEDVEPELDAEKVVKLITSVGKLKGIAMKMGQSMNSRQSIRFS